MPQIAAYDIYESLTDPRIANGMCYGAIWEDQGVQLLARVMSADNTIIQQSEVTSITCKVFNLDTTTPGTAVATPSVTVASVIFNSLQEAAGTGRWDYDTTGYNFKHQLPATAFATGNARYRIEYEFDPATAGEENFMLIYELTVRERYGG